jgi:hypothetical protein
MREQGLLLIILNEKQQCLVTVFNLIEVLGCGLGFVSGSPNAFFSRDHHQRHNQEKDWRKP